jgi:hypothetical protein
MLTPGTAACITAAFVLTAAVIARTIRRCGRSLSLPVRSLLTACRALFNHLKALPSGRHSEVSERLRVRCALQPDALGVRGQVELTREKFAFGGR